MRSSHQPIGTQRGVDVRPRRDAAEPALELRIALTPPLDDAETTLRLLAHPESRQLRRIAAVAPHLAGAIRLA